MYSGSYIQVERVGEFAELIFNAVNDKVNKFDSATLADLKAAVDAVEAAHSGGKNIRGLVVTSAKSMFIVGADITEFGGLFKNETEVLIQWLTDANQIFNRIEDLPFPTITAVNGLALGGGCEMALSTDFRVINSKGKIGLPEIKLGLCPGFGGTVRLPRIIGLDNAVDLICAGKDLRAADALKQHLVDSVVAASALRDSAFKIVEQAADGKLNWQGRRQRKLSPLSMDPMELRVALQFGEGFIAQNSKGYKAPSAAFNAMKKGAMKGRDEALKHESQAFAYLAKTSEANAQIGLFFGDQLIKKKAGKARKSSKPVNKAAVLGAGIMGGGIAYQSAYKGTPIIMKDAFQAGIDTGMGEAVKLLSKRVARGRMDTTKMAQVLAKITPTLAYGEGDFKEVDVVVEAVPEILSLKHRVLREAEGACSEGTIIASNTSSIPIDSLADCLENPENFCGMHFFNPVHMMPLVEVIRGARSSDAAVATTVAYAAQMGKSAIVVGDCPGFYVNRVLFPYFAGFEKLVSDGVDFSSIDKVMNKFGWPMGPAQLLDVVGIDTSHHVAKVLADGYPDRMAATERTAIDVMNDNDRYGQKNSRGFYNYEPDKRGKPKKKPAPEVAGLLAEIQPNGTREADAAEIIERMMIPMVIEVARCLEEEIVATALEADMGLIYGIGFPPFRGGALRYVDQMGLATFCELADKYAHLGKLYESTARMREMAANGESYHQQ